MEVVNHDKYQRLLMELNPKVCGLTARILWAMFLYADIYPETVNHRVDMQEMGSLANWIAVTIEPEDKEAVRLVLGLTKQLTAHKDLANGVPCDLCGSRDRYHMSSECPRKMSEDT